MKYRSLILALILTNSSHAGLNGLTYHSRANCLTINETIAWDATRAWPLYVFSEHKKWNGHGYDVIHKEPTVFPYEMTWRCAVVHVKEAYNKAWWVSGEVWLLEDDWMERVSEPWALDCSIYDGWWDNDHPERKT